MIVDQRVSFYFDENELEELDELLARLTRRLVFLVIKNGAHKDLFMQVFREAVDSDLYRGLHYTCESIDPKTLCLSLRFGTHALTHAELFADNMKHLLLSGRPNNNYSVILTAPGLNN